MSEQSSGGEGCGCFSIIIFILFIMFIYHNCTQRSWYKGAAVMKNQYENLKKKVEDTQDTMKKGSGSLGCVEEWTKENGQWIKHCLDTLKN
jgi:hypothetical protein